MLFSNGWWHCNHRLGSSDSIETLKLLDDFSKIIHLSEFDVSYNVKLPRNSVSHFYSLDFECSFGDFPWFARFSVD